MRSQELWTFLMLAVLLAPASLLPLHLQINPAEAVRERHSGNGTQSRSRLCWNTQQPPPILLLLML